MMLVNKIRGNILHQWSILKFKLWFYGSKERCNFEFYRYISHRLCTLIQKLWFDNEMLLLDRKRPLVVLLHAILLTHPPECVKLEQWALWYSVWNDKARPFPRSWHRFPPIAGISDMAGTGGGWGGAARDLFSEPVPPWSAWKKSQDKARGRRRGQGREFSPHLRLRWRGTYEIFHHGHCGGSPSLAVQPPLSFVILVQLGLIY